MIISDLFLCANHFIKYKFFKKKNPFLAGFKITLKCNLKCKHCPFWKNIKEDLDFQGVQKVLDYFYKAGVKVIIFEGGEPTLWSDGKYSFYDVLEYAKKNFLSVNFTTNGLNGFDFPADAIWVSLDGMENSHDYIRGKGVFKKVINNLKKFQKKKWLQNKTKIFANICITNKNIKDIPELIVFLRNLVDGITIQFYYPYNNDFSLFVNKKDRIWILDKIIQLKRLGLPILDSIECLRFLKNNSWDCHPELLINAESNGEINQGCYIKNRGEINCKYCGFAAHVELSNAFDFKLSSIFTGFKIFLQK